MNVHHPKKEKKLAANNKSVLLIEDSETFGFLITSRINTELNLETIWVKSYGEAANILNENPSSFFITITDLHLPDADMNTIIDLPISKNIPTVPITGEFTDDIQDFIWSKRVIDHVIKEGPHAVDYLIDLVKRINENCNNKILVVDDSLTARTHLTHLLSYHKYTILEAKNGLEALSILENDKDIKLVITDYKMPEMDGFELTKHIRTKFPMDKLGIIGLSADGNHNLSVKFIKYGANDFIPKPFVSEQLYCRVVQNIKLIDQFNTIKNMSHTDYLTGMYNRRHFYEMAPLLIKNAKRNNSNIAIAMMDIDHFKHVNDTYGHKAGDIVLVTIAEIIKDFFRESDLSARFGGEEFCILGSNMDQEKCREVFDRLRTKIEECEIDTGDETIKVTISIGICCERKDNLDRMISEADEKLYHAKNTGRNRVVI